MLASLKELPKKFLEWWNKFTVKQKFIIMGVVAVVVALLIVLIAVLNRDKYVDLITCDTTKDAAEVVSLLEGESVAYEVSEDGLRIKVKSDQKTKATLLLGENGIPTTSYTLDMALDGGLSTTESDKQKKYVLAIQSELESDLESYQFVKRAIVKLSIPTDDGTLISNKAESSASVCLQLSGQFTPEMAQGMAKFIATGLGNDTTDKIVIMDTEGKLYFSGTDEESLSAASSTQYAMKAQYENERIAMVTEALLKLGEFSSISVAPNYDIDFAYTEKTDHTYNAPDGRTEGMLANESRYESEATSGVGGIPGTTSNDETVTYDIDTGNQTTETVVEYNKDYVPDEHITYQTIPAGSIKYGNSSVAVTTVHYTVVKEEDVRLQGLLDEMSWEEYQLANSARTKLEVDEDWIQTVAKATGISTNNISFVAYDENMFIDAEGGGISITDILQILLIVVILGLLAFVVLRSMASGKKHEEEEELSVEDLLQSTPKEELEDISTEEKSEARKLVEKFVTENPDAAANLLRNWLMDDWG
ncbi:MAG: flagellar M-ring protein FliF [Lachnospiraceae bacterium]|nr:flagellar M-ring protein FliF [Candidatus Merdinaster equi]